MRLILASSWAKMKSIGGRRVPMPFYEENGFRSLLRSIWRAHSKVMIITASPEDYEANDERLAFYKESLALSGLDWDEVVLIDGRYEAEAERLGEMDALLLLGGHVPALNEHMKRIGLRERLQDFQGLVLAYSAGSMNCAETVYAAPELNGEGLDPAYERWISGLGLTKIHVLPHFQWLRDETVDGLRMVEDIAMPDSFREPILALNDGSYVVCEDGVERICGDAWWIRDGVMERA